MENAQVIFQAPGNNYEDTTFVFMRATIDGIEEWSVLHLKDAKVVRRKSWTSPSMALRYFADVTYTHAYYFYEEEFLPVLDEVFERELNRKFE
tara:strand:- start:12975 stop:13253 length:279 start_codon:yes stop_codon:yes gene_type:complete